MRVMLIPASIPRSERAPKAEMVMGKRGRPAIHTCHQQIAGQRVGRPAQSGPIQFRTTSGKRGRPAFQGPIEQLIFFGPQQKRGPKPMTAEEKALKAAERAQNTAVNSESGKKRGRLSIADKIKAAKPGETVKEKGGYWIKLACGLASWVGQAA